MCKDLRMASESGLLSERNTSFKEQLLTYLVPFYTGVLFTCVLKYPKKDKSFAFTLVIVLGAFFLILERRVDFRYSPGLTLLSFAGGFFDGVTPTYCTFSQPIAVFEVSPKESFSVAGTIGYLAVLLQPH